MPYPRQPFLETLYNLRTIEQLILYDERIDVSAENEKAASDFLEGEYERESCNYPYTPPAFNRAAALWGAKTLYFAAQLFLSRKDKPSSFATLFPGYKGKVDAAAMLSADLCLRFIPQIHSELKSLDADDPLLPVLDETLRRFHYSAIGGGADTGAPGYDFSAITDNLCLKQLYADRVMEYRNIKLAVNETVKMILAESLGHHKTYFWPELAL